MSSFYQSEKAGQASATQKIAQPEATGAVAAAPDPKVSFVIGSLVQLLLADNTPGQAAAYLKRLLEHCRGNPVAIDAALAELEHYPKDDIRQTLAAIGADLYLKQQGISGIIRSINLTSDNKAEITVDDGQRTFMIKVAF